MEGKSLVIYRIILSLIDEDARSFQYGGRSRLRPWRMTINRNTRLRINSAGQNSGTAFMGWLDARSSASALARRCIQLTLRGHSTMPAIHSVGMVSGPAVMPV